MQFVNHIYESYRLEFELLHFLQVDDARRYKKYWMNLCYPFTCPSSIGSSHQGPLPINSLRVLALWDPDGLNSSSSLHLDSPRAEEDTREGELVEKIREKNSFPNSLPKLGKLPKQSHIQNPFLLSKTTLFSALHLIQKSPTSVGFLSIFIRKR